MCCRNGRQFKVKSARQEVDSMVGTLRFFRRVPFVLKDQPTHKTPTKIVVRHKSNTSNHCYPSQVASWRVRPANKDGPPPY